MRTPPAFFESIRQRASNRWDQLEQDPELAGPWHQLFKQVQSPRHILSELLQNADDAGATEASVRVEQGVFVFAHNGEDFTEEHFASLCRFGYSNKRALHTIGFRGIGFKSTFSLGDRVSLFTPTLAVNFHRQRFTQPEWMQHGPYDEWKTFVVVRIADEIRQKEVEKNLQEWVESPVSLLFFKTIRRIRIGEHTIQWRCSGVGPVRESEWMVLDGDSETPYLLVRSLPEPFPEEALAEIRQERMLGADEDTHFPPSRVEIVLGAPGRLYVVLPTGVFTNLPFACNAPFIQDPARLKIKDPEISITNRWLLERTGRLAVRAMEAWLENSLETVESRSRAYELLAPFEPYGQSLEKACELFVKESFFGRLNRQRILLTESGEVVGANHAVIFPQPLRKVWDPEKVVFELDPLQRPALCRHVTPESSKKLQAAFLADPLKKESILSALKKQSLPRPDTWEQMLALWGWVAPEVTGYLPRTDPAELRIMPVHGEPLLHAAKDLVRIGEQRWLHSEADWEFLSRFLLVLDSGWVRFLEQRKQAEQQPGRTVVGRETRDAHEILRKTGLDSTSHVDRLINQVASAFFASAGATVEGGKRLAQIAAKLDADVRTLFSYYTRDGQLRAVEEQVFVDDDGQLEPLLPNDRRAPHLLHPVYSSGFVSCSRDEWMRWVGKGRAGLLTFIPLEKREIEIIDRRKLEQQLAARGLQGTLQFPYKTRHFILEDWDFANVFLEQWERLSKEDDLFWGKLIERLLDQGRGFWEGALKVAVLHVATTGTRRPMTDEEITPSWVLRFRDLACVPDTRGFVRKPGELLRRTPETEALLDVEPFVHGRLDLEANRSLLDLLGVSSTPTGPQRILERLRSLSGFAKPPIEEVEKWYRRLDKMSESVGTEDFKTILETFQTEKMILGADGTWQNTSGIFLQADEDDVPGAAVIRTAVRDLRLWTRLGVGDRPTADLAIHWLKALPTEEKLGADEFRRVRALLGRHPKRIWEETGCWLNLIGELVPSSGLTYSLTMQALVSWQHLHLWVKRQTADLRQISVEVASMEPFSRLLPLATVLEERLPTNPVADGPSVERPWLRVLGEELSWVDLDMEDETDRVRQRARVLARTVWVPASGVELVPYIGGTPAGLARRPGVAWIGQALYVDGLPKAKLARLVPEEIGKAFNRSDIKSALDYAFERSSDEVRAYLRENFQISAVVEPVDESNSTTDPEVEEALLTANRSPADEQPESDMQESPGGEPAAPVWADNETERTAQGMGKSNEIEHTDNEHPDVDNVPLSSDSSEDDFALEPEAGRHRRERTSKTPMIDRFAHAQGFIKAGDNRYSHPEGSWIARVAGEVFPWERRNAQGQLVRSYWAKDHCLEKTPLEVPAEVWGLIEQRPEQCALILADIHGTPTEWTGASLLTVREKQAITLYPATYRLVYEDRPQD